MEDDDPQHHPNQETECSEQPPRSIQGLHRARSVFQGVLDTEKTKFAFSLSETEKRCEHGDEADKKHHDVLHFWSTQAECLGWEQFGYIISYYLGMSMILKGKIGLKEHFLTIFDAISQ